MVDKVLAQKKDWQFLRYENEENPSLDPFLLLYERFSLFTPIALKCARGGNTRIFRDSIFDVVFFLLFGGVPVSMTGPGFQGHECQL